MGCNSMTDLAASAPVAALHDAPVQQVAIIGAGSIGVAFALLFALAGRSVRLFDLSADALAAAPQTVLTSLRALRAAGLATATDAELLAHISTFTDLAQAVAGADWVQECAPEQLPLKRALFADLDRLAPASAVLASSSSALRASEFAAELPAAGQARCLVAHPGNPPYLLRILEIVPAPFTAPAITARAEAFTLAVGLTPIRVRKEVEGFVFNRLQGALLREAYCLVRDGVASVEDIDTLIRDGLGLRWSVIGPFETADLNTRGGIASHAVKMGPAYARMGAERGQHDPWTEELVAEVVAQRRALLPLEAWQQRVEWRDRALIRALAARAASADDTTAG
jgi:L-gulonate 3-dehydrogenase